MKNKLIFLLFIFIIFGVIIGVYYFLELQKAKIGTLKIFTSPKAVVYLDDKKIGTTPLEKNLAVGEYILRLVPNNTASPSAIWKSKININEAAITHIDRYMGVSDINSSGIIVTMTKTNTLNNTGVIEVDSEPSQAIVSLDNIEQGITSLTIRNIEQGDHELSVTNPGFLKRTQKINVRPNFKVSVLFKLAIDPTFEKIDILPTINPSPGVQTIKIKQTETGWLRVRDEPIINSSESAKVNPDQEFIVVGQENGWYKIEYQKGKFGWVSGQYVEIID